MLTIAIKNRGYKCNILYSTNLWQKQSKLLIIINYGEEAYLIRMSTILMLSSITCITKGFDTSREFTRVWLFSRM